MERSIHRGAQEQSMIPCLHHDRRADDEKAGAIFVMWKIILLFADFFPER
jgi:hypothetical protein